MFIPLSRLVLFIAALLLAGCGGGGGESSGVPVTMTLSASVTTPSEIALSWTPDPGVNNGYDLYRNGAPVFSTHFNGTSVSDYNLNASTRYCYVVYAIVFPFGAMGKSNQACVTTSATAGWNIVAVDKGTFVSLALDTGNRERFGYRNSGGVQVAKNTIPLSIDSIDANAGAYGHTSIGIDSSGATHTTYADMLAGGLRYATDSIGSSWTYETIDTSGGWGNALVLDGAGKAHVSYSNSGLKYATNATGTWVSNFISGGNINRTSLSLDSNEKVHIAYVGGSGLCSIFYTENSSGNWQGAVIDTGAHCGVALAIDASDHAHIAYMKSYSLYYATNSSGTWVTGAVDTFTWVGGNEVSIAIDGSNWVHISYQDQNKDLKYITNKNGVWQSKYIASNGDVGGYSQIRVDSIGKIHIAYTDETSGTVKLATSP